MFNAAHFMGGGNTNDPQNDTAKDSISLFIFFQFKRTSYRPNYFTFEFEFELSFCVDSNNCSVYRTVFIFYNQFVVLFTRTVWNKFNGMSRHWLFTGFSFLHFFFNDYLTIVFMSLIETCIGYVMTTMFELFGLRIFLYGIGLF